MNPPPPSTTPPAPADSPEHPPPGAHRVALVTGAARRIGAQISRTLHRRGVDIALHCRSSHGEGQALADELNAVRENSAILLHADLGDYESLRELPQAVTRHWGRLDILVHNASSFFPTPLGQVTSEQWEVLFNSNLRGPFFLSQAAAPALHENHGCIISIIDIHAERPLRDHPVYCIAKAGLAMMTRALAKELAPQVRVNGVSPGYILRPSEGMDDTVHQVILDRTALKRQGSPADIAGAVAYLALDAPYISGQILAVDGGRSLHM